MLRNILSSSVSAQRLQDLLRFHDNYVVVFVPLERSRPADTQPNPLDTQTSVLLERWQNRLF